jgi:hypothetical protein
MSGTCPETDPQELLGKKHADFIPLMAVSIKSKKHACSRAGRVAAKTSEFIINTEWTRA